MRPTRRRRRRVRRTRTLMSVGGVPVPRRLVWNIGHDHNYVVIIVSRRLGASVMHCWTMSGRLVSVVSRMFCLLLTDLHTTSEQLLHYRKWAVLERRSAGLFANTQVKVCSRETHSFSRASKYTDTRPFNSCREVKREYYQNWAGLCDTMFTVSSTLI